MYITKTEQLREVVERMRQSPVVGIDTEFMRERTYFARLCLVQLSTGDLSVILDPLAVDDLSPLCDLLADPNVLKILHAGSQDLEIFFKACGVPTAPVFDTQIAATLAGFPQQTGYGALVLDLLGVKLDKGDTYTDWSRRPLSDTQVEYALNDVRYLPEMYRLLTEKLERTGRTAWLSADFARLENPATYSPDPRELWRKIKKVSSLNRRQMAVAREVAAWRESEAMRRDVPKRWILGDESVIEVSRRAPRTVDEALQIRGVGDKMAKQALRSLVAAVAEGAKVAEEDLPQLTRRRRPQGDIDGAVDLMIAIVRLRAKQQGVAMPLMASRDDLERLASGDREGSPLLEGWRAEMVGRELIDLLEGKLSLRLVDGELVMVGSESSESM